MKQDAVAVKLYEAIQDGKDCYIEDRVVSSPIKDKKKFFVHVDGRTYPVSRKFVLNAIKWCIRIVHTRYYQIGSICYAI